MTDLVTAPQPFTTIKYTTKDGEHISATKNNGVVTLVGDKNGVRQIPLEDFKKELTTNIADIQLEKTPEKDTVEIGAKTVPAAAQSVAEPKPVPAPAEPIKETEAAKKLDVSA